jgi:hypothetical protein
MYLFYAKSFYLFDIHGTDILLLPWLYLSSNQKLPENCTLVGSLHVHLVRQAEETTPILYHFHTFLLKVFRFYSLSYISNYRYVFLSFTLKVTIGHILVVSSLFVIFWVLLQYSLIHVNQIVFTLFPWKCNGMFLHFISSILIVYMWKLTNFSLILQPLKKILLFF